MNICARRGVSRGGGSRRDAAARIASGARRTSKRSAVSGPRVAVVTQPLWKQAHALPRHRRALARRPRPRSRARRSLAGRRRVRLRDADPPPRARACSACSCACSATSQEAEDVAQETFLNLHRHGHRFRSQSRFSTFLYRVAVNAALNRRRSLGRRRARTEALERRQLAGDDLPSSPRDPEDSAAGAQIQARVQREVRRPAAAPPRARSCCSTSRASRTPTSRACSRWRRGRSNRASIARARRCASGLPI